MSPVQVANEAVEESDSVESHCREFIEYGLIDVARVQRHVKESTELASRALGDIEVLAKLLVAVALEPLRDVGHD